MILPSAAGARTGYPLDLQAYSISTYLAGAEKDRPPLRANKMVGGASINSTAPQGRLAGMPSTGCGFILKPATWCQARLGRPVDRKGVAKTGQAP